MPHILCSRLLLVFTLVRGEDLSRDIISFNSGHFPQPEDFTHKSDIATTVPFCITPLPTND